MRYEVTIEQTSIIPMVLEAKSEAEALVLASRQLLDEFPEPPDAMGDPITEPPRIRSVRTLGE